MDVLRHGEIEVLGRLPWSSNATFLADVCVQGMSTRAVYKPRQGERSLWDFPDGLHKRESAAYELSEALGWGLVPPTVVRDGPLGEGSVQMFVPADFEQHYYTLYEQPEHHSALKAICAFDVVANSTDRKSGHCLLSEDGRIYAVDNGLSFHAELKLRTVIWEFGGQPIPHRLLTDLGRLTDEGLPPVFWELLDPHEVDALLTRVVAVVHEGVFPVDPTGHRYPWPPV